MTAPECVTKPQDVLQSDAQLCIDELDAQGDDPGYENCSGGGPGSSCDKDSITKKQAMSIRGTAAVWICGDTSVCMGCAQLANYIEGSINTCSVGDQVGGKQVLNAVNGSIVVGMAPL